MTAGPIHNCRDWITKQAVQAKRGPKKDPLLFDSIIVTLPDPETTSLGLYFDRMIQSIQWAAESAEYSYFAYSFPWREKEDPQTPNPRFRRENSQEAARRLSQPGVMLFRPSATRSTASFQSQSNARPLAIWLVSETPTSGINPIQFRESVLLARAGVPGCLRPCRKKSAPATQVRVLGTTYSGALDSLDRAIKQLEHSYPGAFHFQVISGSVTSGRNADSFSKQHPPRDFHLMLHTDEAALEFARQYFAGHWPTNPPRFGLLRESETDFGSSIGSMGRDQNQGAIVMTYPRDISVLRRGTTDNVNGGAPQLFSPLQLPIPRIGRELPPRFAPDQLSVSQTAALHQIVETIRTERLGFLGIFASNVFDLIYLADFVKRRYSDIRLFTFDNDLLYIRGVSLMPLEGTVSFVTHPLSLRTEGWTQSYSRTRRAFSSQLEVGWYNGLLYLLGQRNPPKFEGIHSPFNRGEERPLWATVVGYDSYWPQRTTLPSQQDAKHLVKAWTVPGRKGPVTLSFGAPSRLYIFLSLALKLLAIGAIATNRKLFGQLRLGPGLRITPPHWLLVRSGGWMNAWCGTHGGIYVSLLLLNFLLDFPLYIVASDGFDVYYDHFIIVAAVALCILLSVSLLASALICLHLPYASGTSWRVRGPRRLFTVSVLLLALSAILFGARFWSLPDNQVWGGVVRWMTPSSGVSPNVPALWLLLLVLAYSWFHYKIWRWWGEHDPVMPEGWSDPRLPQFHREVQREQDLSSDSVLPNPERTASPQPRHSKFRPWGEFAGFVTFIIFIPPYGHQGLDGKTFDLLYGGLLSFSVFLTIRCLSSVRTSWHHLKTFTLNLEAHPIRFNFDKLPPQYSRFPLWQPGGTRGQGLNRRRSMEALIAMEARNEPWLIRDARGYAPLLANTRQAYQDWQLDRRATPTDSPSKLLTLRFAEMADHLIHALQSHWLRTGTDTADVRRHDHQDESAQAAMEFVALRYFARIRFETRVIMFQVEFLACALPLMLVAVQSYPFLTANRILWFLFLLVLWSALETGRIALGLHRNAILRRISSPELRTARSEFFKRIALYSFLPVVVASAWVFPRWGAFLYSIVKPVFDLVGR